MEDNKKLNDEGNTATPYDDVYRTLLNDCTSLIIPVVNEVFQKQHGEHEKVTVLNNEFFITSEDGKQKVVQKKRKVVQRKQKQGIKYLRQKLHN